ncbi:TMEM175 family protein [Geomonas edaphica]|uniref:TMEM175 family protein n=1 Tax=Geomonas edaphica TaxID=2570226 RepID=UPI0010A945B3|nr:TMEM175 family protein [Geomonas edaphica]
MSKSSERNETERLEAFSDGVFAIAITLLVLTIQVPKPSALHAGDSLGSALLALWPHYLAFVTSFATILAKWVNHHRIFTFVKRSDHTFLYLNGLTLLLITFLPFPTALAAEYLLHPEAKVASAFFSGTFFAIALAFKSLWHYASKGGRLIGTGRSADATHVEQIRRQLSFGPTMYLAAFSISFVSATMSVLFCLCIAVFIGFKGWPQNIPP